MALEKIAVELVAKMDGLQRDFAQAGNLAEQTAQRMKQAFSGYDALGMPIERSAREIAELSAKASTQMANMGMSAKATAAAMRGVPAQFTDIITSLQGGQKPLTVLLQQGGQLKDMFGGIGPAFSALGSYALGLVNPFTVAAVAIGGIGYAAYAGAEESRALAKALIITGNAAGTTAGQLQDMAASVSASSGATKGAAAETLTQLVSTGKVAAGSLDAAAASALRMERAGGTAAEEMVKAFAALGKEPVEASIRLNDQYNYLTASTYRQIKALEDQGRSYEAVELAQRTFADASDGMASKLEKNLGIIEKGWRGIKDAVKGAGDAMLSIGRTPSLQDQLNAVENRLKAMDQIKNSRLPMSLSEKARFGPEYAALKDQSFALAEALQGEKAVSAELQFQNEKKKQALEWEKDSEKYLKNRERLEKEIARIETLGAAAGASRAEIDKRIAMARERLEEKAGGSTPKAAKQQADDFERLAESLREKIAVQKEELSVTEKLNAAQKEYAKFNEQIKGNNPKLKLSAEELAQAKKLWDEYLKQAQEIEARAQQKVFKAAQDNISSLSESFGRDNKMKLSGLEIMPDAQRELIGAIAAVEEKARVERERFNDLQARGNITKEQRIQLTNELTVAIDRQKEAVRQYHELNMQNNASFEYGAKKGLQSYLDSVANVAKSSEELMANAFKGMEDALVDFVQTGKLDFKSLINSMLADMARITIRENITGPLARWMQGGSSDSGGSSFGGIFSAISSFFGGGSSSMPQLWANANGGVYSSPGLSAFSGQIVSSPTLFKFATGAGLMGEAGPEAILPLKRSSSGKLGVQAAGGFSPIINLTINGEQSAPDVRRSAAQGLREALAAFSQAQRYA